MVKELIEERLYWVRTYEAVQQLGAAIIGANADLDPVTINEIHRQCEDIRIKWDNVGSKVSQQQLW